MDVETLKEDLKTYRNIETWGSGLFLTGIALVGQQFLKWKAEGKVILLWWAPMVPTFIGLYALIFLLVVNRRGRTVRARIDSRTLINPRGALGWLFALMPPTFGWLISAALGATTTELILLGITGVAIVIIAYLVDHYRRELPR